MARKEHRWWAYKNTMLLVLSIILFVSVLNTETAHSVIRSIGRFEYVGAFAAGFFMVFTFTFAPAAVVLYHIAQELNPWIVTLVATIGAVIGDTLIFRFLKDSVYEELSPVVVQFNKRHHLTKLFKTPYFAWFVPVLGAIIVALPMIPDEPGIALMGLSRMSSWQFIAITFVLDMLGIFAVVSVARVF